MKIKFYVNIGLWDLYDYFFTHEFKKPISIAATLIGLAAIAMFFFRTHTIMHLIIGVLVLVYLPWTLLLNCLVKLKTTPSFKKPLDYELNDVGITITQDGASDSQNWEDMLKATSTMRSYIIYTSKKSASILPKKQLKGQLGDSYGEVAALIQEKMNVKL